MTSLVRLAGGAGENRGKGVNRGTLSCIYRARLSRSDLTVYPPLSSVSLSHRLRAFASRPRPLLIKDGDGTSQDRELVTSLHLTLAMPDVETVSRGHHRLPILTHDNFAHWEMAIISFLTGAPDHVRVIEQRPKAKGELVDPVRPEEVVKWGSPEREAMSVIITTASKLHRDVILKHRAERGTVFKAMDEAHQPRDASLRHQAWIEFFSSKKTSDESYSAYIARKEGLGARVDLITPVSQPRADHFAELILSATLIGLPYEDNVRQTLVTQADLTLQQARAAMVRVDTGAKMHMANTETVNAAGTSNCWKWDTPGHLASACPHTGAIKDIVAKRNAAYR